VNTPSLPLGAACSLTRVLLIEDNPGDTFFLEETLAEEPIPFVVETVTSLLTALDRLRAGGIELVLTDLSLPDSASGDTFPRLQAAAPGVPIIILSGLDDEPTAAQMVEKGAQDYLVKGRIDHHCLVRAIRYALERNRFQAELQRAHDQLEERVQERTTELAQTAAQLQEALAKLHEAQQCLVQQERLHALGRMASGIAHDFNNALAPIVGFSELLLKDSPLIKAKSREYLQLIHTAARDSADVVRRLREFYRFRDEHDVFTPIALNELVQEVALLTKPRWKDQALGRGADIQLSTDLQRVPLISGSESELRELMINLIFNAVDAIPRDGTITLRTFSRGQSVVFQVSDTGTGMPEDVRLRCLEPFFSTKAEHGTGLGLAMVFGIVRRHEGQLEIESAPGQGTTITLSLAAHEAAELPEPVAQAAGPQSALSILVVDDEPSVRDVLSACLEEDGHRVATATNGHEGLERFDSGEWDLVLTDRAMPQMNGDQFAAAIRARDPQMPIILVTGFADLMKQVGEHPGCFDVVIQKPFTLGSLREGMSTALALHSCDDAVEPAVSAASRLAAH